MSGDRTSEAIAALRTDAARVQEKLAELVSVAGVSARAFPAGEVRRSATAVAETLVEYGMENVRLLETAGHPAVYGESLVSAEAPTLLIYGHHDVQPPGRLDKWLTPPYKPRLREDGRLYGRGAVDDKAGVMMHISPGPSASKSTTRSYPEKDQRSALPFRMA